MKHRKWFLPFPILRVVLSLLIAGQGFPASELFAVAPVGFKVVSAYTGNPTAITSIRAAPDFTVPEEAGGVLLEWSAPQAADGSSVFSYVVKYATYPASDFASHEDWWNSPNTLTALEQGIPPDWGILAKKPPGETETVALSGLVPAQYYYFGVRSRDRFYRMSDYDDDLETIADQAQTYAATPPWTPAKITSLSAQATSGVGAVRLSWTAPELITKTAQFVSGKIYYPGEYCVQYSTISPPGSINRPHEANNWEGSSRIFFSTYNVNTSEFQMRDITGLFGGTTYYFAAFTRNEWPDHWSNVSFTAAVRPYGALQPVNSLTGVAGGSNDPSVGSYAGLEWTNPAGEDYFRGVRICYSTSDYPSSPVSPYYADLEPLTTGEVSAYQHNALIPRTTYYYTVYAYDISRYYSTGVSTSVYTGIDLLAPYPVENLTGLADVRSINEQDDYFVTLSWTTPDASPAHVNSDYAGAKVYFSTWTADPALQAQLTDVSGANGQSQSYLHSGLKVYSTYYYSVFTYDAVNNVSTTPVTTSVYLPESLITPSRPALITMLVTADPDPDVGCGVYLRWTAPSEAVLSGVRIVYRTDGYPQNSSDGTVWTDRAAAPNNNYEFSANQLTPSTTYYISIFAYSSYGRYSYATNIQAFTRIPWTDELAPHMPLGINISMESADSVRLGWSQVRYNANRTRFAAPAVPRLNELYRYEIYRSTDVVWGPWSLRGTAGSTGAQYADTLADDNMYYYKVRSMDASRNSSDSYAVDMNGFVHVLCSDGSSISLSQELLTESMMLLLNRDEDEERGPIIKSLNWAAYRVVESSSTFALEAMPAFTSYQVAGSTGELSGLSISYTIPTANGAVTAPALRAMSPRDFENNLSVYYHNGVEWLKVGSRIDTVKKTVTAKAKFAGRYQLRRAAPATEFTFYGIMPRIITPNSDGENDRALFRFANPKAAGISIKIFDLTGALVMKLDETTMTSDVHGEYLWWDGRDEDGETVPVGVYIYQLEGEGKVVNGTVVVAR